MIRTHDTGGFSLIEAVVAMAVLGVGIVAVFTIFHTVIIGERVSEEMLDQSLNINGIVNEIRTDIPEAVTGQAFILQAESIASRYPGWQLETQSCSQRSDLYTLQLSYEPVGGKKKVFYAKVVHP